MNLHNDPVAFSKAIRETASRMNQTDVVVEKDYHVMRLLRELTRQQNALIFKGGTSLSKCHHIINRFSEDIDLAYDHGDSLPTKSMRRDTTRLILSVATQCGYRIENKDEIHENDRLCRFEFSYEPVFIGSMNIRPRLIVEILFSMQPFRLK